MAAGDAAGAGAGTGAGGSGSGSGSTGRNNYDNPLEASSTARTRTMGQLPPPLSPRIIMAVAAAQPVPINNKIRYRSSVPSSSDGGGVSCGCHHYRFCKQLLLFSWMAILIWPYNAVDAFQFVAPPIPRRNNKRISGVAAWTVTSSISSPATSSRIRLLPKSLLMIRSSCPASEVRRADPRRSPFCYVSATSSSLFLAKNDEGASPSGSSSKESRGTHHPQAAAKAKTKTNKHTKKSKASSSSSNKSNNKKQSSKMTNKKKKKDNTTTKQEQIQRLGRAIQKQRRKQQQQQQHGGGRNKETERESSNRLLDRINPWKAGQNLRNTIQQSITTFPGTANTNKAVPYYYDDDHNEYRPDNASSRHHPATTSSGSSGSTSSSSTRAEEEANDNDYIPEVLVIGATGELGQKIVQQLKLMQSEVRVRVLVRDLYTQTLNKLGTGVTYCQGDLDNVDSLEYALTDVDKIVFCAAAATDDSATPLLADPSTTTGRPYHQDRGVAAAAAQNIDERGMQNVVRAYQNVRHADYGTSQAAKRSLFKFDSQDFYLFEIDEDDDNIENGNADYDSGNASVGGKNDAARSGNEESSSSSSQKITTTTTSSRAKTTYSSAYDDEDFDDEEDEYDDQEYDDDYADYYGAYDDEDDDDIEDRYATGAAARTTTTTIEKRSDAAVQAQSMWFRNAFDHGVFVGRIPAVQAKTTNSQVRAVEPQAAIVSSRLRSREDPDLGIELGPAFAGFICRVCSDGGVYEAFVRTGLYYSTGIEYVCEFSTPTKEPVENSRSNNKSRNKFTTVRLPFLSFKPVRRRKNKVGGDDDNDYDIAVPPFRGRDVRNIGFRFRSLRNTVAGNQKEQMLMSSSLSSSADKWTGFYLALSYIKLYRSQPEPEFVYLSDARIPPILSIDMVRHEAKQLVTSSSAGQEIQFLDESSSSSSSTTASPASQTRTPEETYYKYRGEEILKQSGLSYAIVRVFGFNDSPFSDLSRIDLRSDGCSDDGFVSRADVARICVQALLDPHALNKSFYVTNKDKEAATSLDEDMSMKFASLPVDEII